MFKLFTQQCQSCGGPNLGPREGGKARGRWLGYDRCIDCRNADNRQKDGGG
jgi:hypothetical protein